MSDYVEVVGAGTAEAPTDRVQLRLEATARSESVAEAFTQANLAMQRMVTALRENGVEELQSSGLEIYPDHDRNGEPNGFRASVGMRVTLVDVSEAGVVIAAAVDAGGDASRVNGLQLSSSSTGDAQVAAREAAWQDAVAKAEQYAALAGRRLGKVLEVSERARHESPSPKLALMSASAADVEGGTQTVVATLAVRWALED